MNPGCISDSAITLTGNDAEKFVRVQFVGGTPGPETTDIDFTTEFANSEEVQCPVSYFLVDSDGVDYTEPNGFVNLDPVTGIVTYTDSVTI